MDTMEFDALIVDMQLEDGSAAELFDECEQFKSKPVVVISASDQSEHDVQAGYWIVKSKVPEHEMVAHVLATLKEEAENRSGKIRSGQRL